MTSAMTSSTPSAATTDMCAELKMTTLGGLDNLMAGPATNAEMAEVLRPLLITGLLFFRQPLSLPQVKQLLRERFLEIPRFRSVLRVPATRKGPAKFAEVERSSIDMDAIVQERDDVKTQADIDEFCSSIYMEDLGLELPRWRAFIFNNMADGRHMLCFVIDHAIGDGPALVATLMQVLDSMAQKPGVGSKPRKAVQPSFLSRLSACLGGTCYAFCGDQLPADHSNRLKMKNHRKPGKRKAIAQTPPIRMDMLKACCAKFGGATVNDVLMVVVCLTLKGYFEKYEPETLGKKVRANFPINMRPSGADVLSEEYFGNLFSQGQLRFPLHLDNPQDILSNIKAQIDKIKISPEPLIRQKLVDALSSNSCLPPLMKKDLVLDSYGQVTAMLSNIPGPNGEVQFAGQPLDDMAFYAFAPIGLYFGIVSYKGLFRAGICVDTLCEPEPAKLAEEWTLAFDRVYAHAMSL